MAKDAFKTLVTAAAAAVTLATTPAAAQNLPASREEAAQTMKRVREFAAANGGRLPNDQQLAKLTGRPAAPTCGSATPGAGRSPEEILAAIAEARKIKDPAQQMEAMRRISDPAAQQCAQAAVASGPVADIAYGSFTQWVNGLPAGSSAACTAATNELVKMNGLYTGAQNSPAAAAARSALTSKCGPK